jgi:hypothetical protein
MRIGFVVDVISRGRAKDPGGDSRWGADMEPQRDESRRLEPRRLTTPRAAAVAGIVFALLFTACVLLARVEPDTSAAALAAGIRGTSRSSQSIVALYLVPFAGIAFLWFIGVVRDRIGVREDKFFATIFLGSGILFVATLFGAAAAIAAMLTVSELSPAVADFGRALGRTTLFVYGARSAGVFTLVTSTIVYRTESLPKWAALVGFVVGLALLLSVKWFDLVVLVFPAWVALLSVLVLVAGPALEWAGSED